MKAITYRAYGPASEVLRIEEIESPEPGPGEVRIDIAYSGVNPSDAKARAGARAGAGAMPYPVIVPHSDGAGVISAVGEGVDPARLGRRVWIWNGQWQRPLGTAAEQITLPQEQAVDLPDGVALETGAVLGIPGLTAAHVVFSGGSLRGKTVLVQGGGGTVGFLAVQLAKWGGARVIATCGGRDRDRVLAAGADAALDYAAPDLAAQILKANGGRPVDHIAEVEFGANAATDAAVIAPNGRITAYGSARQMTPELPFYPLMFKSVTLEMVLVYILPPEARAAAADYLHRALMDDALDPPIAEILPMAEAARAHALVEAGNRCGAVLVKIG